MTTLERASQTFPEWKQLLNYPGSSYQALDWLLLKIGTNLVWLH
jgi:hypothetical protein